ncbi:hypothetical protein L596_014104 [Steinernema carpocapsae]|uniref:Protein Wnt n=1 Tax=Steinernema carpocapsae TaxID=34508 RepID=A0A4U5NBS0_STECR|nr:hypothetical protein L596_014104 [Steinernema carpocapsae]
MTPRALLFLLSLTVLVSSAVAIKWLAMHRVHQPWTDPRHCPKTHDDRKSYGLNGYQGRMCRRITELMPIITKAAKETVFGCAKMFADRRWNCSSLLAVPYLRNDLTKDKSMSGTLQTLEDEKLPSAGSSSVGVFPFLAKR